jgi:hypothetical protein
VASDVGVWSLAGGEVADQLEVLAPRARQSGLIVRDLEDEVLVYDLERNQAHCLNRTAGLVFRYCDGITTIGELVELLRTHIGPEADEQTVWHALLRLGKDELLQEQVSWVAKPGMTRRELMQRAGIAVAAATVTSIVVPSATHAASITHICSSSTERFPCCPTGTECGPDQNYVCVQCGGTSPDGKSACCQNAGLCCQGVCCSNSKQNETLCTNAGACP